MSYCSLWELTLKLLAMFSKCLGNDAVVNRLLAANSVEDVMKAFLEEEDETTTEMAEEADLNMDEIVIL